MISIVELFEINKKKVGLGAAGAAGAAEGIGAAGQKHFGKEARNANFMSNIHKSKAQNIKADMHSDDKPSSYNQINSAKQQRDLTKQFKRQADDAEDKSEAFGNIRPSQLASKGLDKLQKGYNKFTGED